MRKIYLHSLDRFVEETQAWNQLFSLSFKKLSITFYSHVVWDYVRYQEMHEKYYRFLFVELDLYGKEKYKTDYYLMKTDTVSNRN